MRQDNPPPARSAMKGVKIDTLVYLPDRTFLVSALESFDWTTRDGPRGNQFTLLGEAVQQAALFATNARCRGVALRSCKWVTAGGWIGGLVKRESDSRWVPAEAIADAAASLDKRSRAALALKLMSSPYELNPGTPPKYVKVNMPPGFGMVPYDPSIGPPPDTRDDSPGT